MKSSTFAGVSLLSVVAFALAGCNPIDIGGSVPQTTVVVVTQVEGEPGAKQDAGASELTDATGEVLSEFGSFFVDIAGSQSRCQISQESVT